MNDVDKIRNWILHATTAPSEGIVVITDPGHAWAQVPCFVVEGLDLIISGFSYQNSDYFWLEEDCDLSTFVKEVKAQLDIELTHNDFNETHVNERETFFRSVGARRGDA